MESNELPISKSKMVELRGNRAKNEEEVWNNRDIELEVWKNTILLDDFKLKSSLSNQSIKGQMKGPDGSVYEGVYYLFCIDVSHSYPLLQPRFHFITPIYHPNVGITGTLDIFHTEPWKQSITITELIECAFNLLKHPVTTGNCASPMAAMHFLNSNGYESIRTIVENYAKRNVSSTTHVYPDKLKFTNEN